MTSRIIRAIGRVLFQLVPNPGWSKVRARRERLKQVAHPKRRRPRESPASSAVIDEEASAPSRRLFSLDAMQGAAPGEEEYDSSARDLLAGQRRSSRQSSREIAGYGDNAEQEETEFLAPSDDFGGRDDGDDEGEMGHEETEAAVAAVRARLQGMDPAEIKREDDKKRIAIKAICGATSTSEMFEMMDTLIESDWLGSVDELPGNIYRLMAFKPWPEPTFAGYTRKFGFFYIVMIQLFGPPLIFYQMFTGASMPDPDQIHWDKFIVPDISDWQGNYWSTKLMALFFLITFCMNGLFVQLDEKSSWKKIDRLFKELDTKNSMDDTSEWFLKVGAFMNNWVISWLVLDVFMVLGTSDTVQDVLMDALGLAFLYNLDDVGGDLGFVDQDNWPGVELSWLYKNLHTFAGDISDVDEQPADECCVCFLRFGTFYLATCCIVLPLLFIVTPFQAMKPDPYFESILNQGEFEGWLNDFVQNAVKDAVQIAVRNVTAASSGEL